MRILPALARIQLEFCASIGIQFCPPPGRRGSDFLIFESGGLRCPDRDGFANLPWDDIARSELINYHKNLFAYLWLRDADAVVAAAQGDRFL